MSTDGSRSALAAERAASRKASEEENKLPCKGSGQTTEFVLTLMQRLNPAVTDTVYFR